MKNLLNIIVLQILIVCCSSFRSGPVERSGVGDEDTIIK